MVSRNFIKLIVYGFVLMFLTAGLLYGFALTQKNSASDKTEADYIGKLTTAVDTMRTTSVDETTLMQKWNSGVIDAGTAVAQFADLKSQRQALGDDFFSRAAPQKFTEVHISLKDANTVWMEADDLYREGIFQRRDDFISAADAKVVTAKGKFDDTLAQIEKLGYKL